ncbi:SDR family NAD(P)-dependent oxidoreductase [Veronia pacifica]|uniref:Short-chain dehydrogenase n=1 Tax=Veronia pacifica TaxID=1080227 RepID=A0A1C3ERP4_9GAMM|nr:SDR family oxidoreductase [Veronia pacifica]ODA35915.1 short-chain dehydrogenase [Veronia pacifica]
MKTFDGKNAVVTGGAGGIGRALLVELAKQGANVAFFDIGDLSQTKELLAQYNVRVYSETVDITKPEQIYAFIDNTIEALGSVDLLVNNAGVALGDRTFDELTPEDFEKITDINYWGVVRTTQYLYPHMVKRPESAVVSISSAAGIQPTPYLVPYCTTKFAVRGFSETLRAEHRIRGINNMTFHTVHPGCVATDITLNAQYHGPNTVQFHQELQKRGCSPAQAAKIMLDGVKKNKGRIFISDGYESDLLLRLFPTVFPTIMRWVIWWRRIPIR